MPDDRAPFAHEPLSAAGRVAVIGAGAFGRFSVGAYAATDDIDVIAVADEDGSRLDQVRVPGATLTTDWRALMADERIEVIHVVTPPFVRGPLVEAALDAGKSVFCEKPLALSLEEADAMIAYALRQGVCLGVDYVMRHQAAYRFLFCLASSGLAGPLQSVSFQNFAQTVPPGHWFWRRAESGGILVEHGVHFFDAFGVVAGPACSVEGRQPRDSVADVMVSYKGGALGRFYHEFAFSLDTEYANGVAAFERGHVTIEGWIPTRLTGAVEASPEAVNAIAAGCGVAPAFQAGPTTRFCANFPDREEEYRDAVVAGMRDVVRRHRDPAHRLTVRAEDARASLALALAGQRACDSGEVAEV